MSTQPPRPSARDNPWYVLATIMEEPTGRADHDGNALQAENRKVWNAWASQGLSDEEKREKSQKSVVDPFEGVQPWSEMKWSGFLGQLCGLAKMHQFFDHAAFLVSISLKYAVSGVRLSRAV